MSDIAREYGNETFGKPRPWRALERDGEMITHRCLVLHGLGGGPYELDPLTQALETSGAALRAPVLPGHETISFRMPASRFEDWERAALDNFDLMAGAGDRMAVIGFSTGGVLALQVAAQRPVSRLVLLAPFFAIRGLGWLPFRLAPVVGQIARVAEHIPRRPPPIRDPTMRRIVSQMVGFRTFNLAAVASALALIDRTWDLLPQIQPPTLVLQGRLDTVVEPAAARRMFDRLGSREKEFCILPRSDHLLALDRDRDEVLSRVLGFLAEPR